MVDFEWASTLERLIAGEPLGRDQARAAMAEVMAGSATTAQISALVTALRMKGETSEEITGMVEAMLAAAVTVEVADDVVDLVGTGGDRSGTFNISTTAAFVAAGAGARIAKHGNRAASSQTGSADLLAHIGLDLDMAPERTAAMIEDTGFGFFFAPRYHPAMRHAAPVRREIGVRTVFNLLGPLCNPARARRYALGVSAPAMAGRMMETLRNLGATHAFVFYGLDGLDELTTTGPSFIYRLVHGEITTAEFTPEDFGVSRATVADLRGGDVEENARILHGVLDGARGPQRDVVLVNASAAIVAAGLADGFVEGVALAARSVDTGAARAVLDSVLAFSRG